MKKYILDREEINTIAYTAFSFYRTNILNDEELEEEFEKWLEKKITTLSEN